MALDKIRSLFANGIPENVRLEQSEWFSWAEKAAKKGAKYDLAFDKDAFGFCNLESRQKYADSVSNLLKPGAVVYMEVKERQKDKDEGKNEALCVFFFFSFFFFFFFFQDIISIFYMIDRII